MIQNPVGSRRLAVGATGLCLVAALTLPTADGAQGLVRSVPTNAPPRLVVLLIVDQCRPDYFERFGGHFTGFFARLRNEGRWFVDGEQHHALTVTAPGHAVLGSGRFPARNGIVGNEFFDPVTGRLVGAANDSTAAPLDGMGGGYSAHRLRGDGIGDWWRVAYPAAKVVGISIKPRSAILPLGRGPHSAWWFDEVRGAFVSSSLCAGAPPDWAVASARQDACARFPTRWERTLDDEQYLALGCTADDQDGEAATGRPPTRTFPHGLTDRDATRRAEALLISPYGDELVLDFARAAVEGEALGADAVPDLLVLGLTSTDLIGHRHGPDSWEIAEQLLALDRALAEFVGFLDAQIGAGELLIAVSSDHGIPALPEVACARGGEGERVDWAMLAPTVDAALIAIDPRLSGAAFPIPEFGIRLDRRRLEAAAQEPSAVARALAAALRGAPPFRDARSHAELQEPLAPDDRVGELMRAASDGERAGDLLFALAPGTIYTPAPYRVAVLQGTLATSHGTPWPDDTRVPLAFLGAGVVPGRVAGRAWTVDVAPTLATAVGIPLPTDLDGHALPLH